jgi:SAM-dependent methyltransferase
MSDSNRTDCPSCGANETRLFHEVADVPVNSVLNVRTREEALNFPRGKLALAHCRHCGFIYNARFEPEKVHYSSECEESQGYSPTFNAFARDLADGLVQKHALRGRRIIEIGCGKGEFLKLLCRLGGNSGIGFDPAYVPGRGDGGGEAEEVEFVKDYYSEKYAGLRGDAICCRMTLEHIPETAELVRTLRKAIGDRYETIVFFQVPDVTRIMRDCAFEDIYYEHCSYFSPGSLARLFRANRFDILDMSVEFGGQYILIEAKPAVGKTVMRMNLEKDLGSVEHSVELFSARHPAVIGYWESVLDKTEQSGRVVIWGSGSKGVTFLNTLRNSGRVKWVVDINPFRQRTFMAGTGQEIVAPEFLASYRPDAVIVMNPIYLDEIKNDLRRMGLAPQVHAMGETAEAPRQ